MVAPPTVPSRRKEDDSAVPVPPEARERYKNLDPYRVDREWRRYEGTAQRDLFRELRVRFLRRHAGSGGWVVDVGSGPGRFLPYLGPPEAHRVALDLSLETLRRVDPSGGVNTHLVRGDGGTPPLARAAFSCVALLGNVLGFSAGNADRLLESAESLVAPGGFLVLEIVAGPGERSRYLTRLPPRSLARLLRSPVRAVQLRAQREGFLAEPPRRRETGEFRRFDPSALSEDFRTRGWLVREVVTVSPALGPVPLSIEAAQSDPKSWEHLLEVEEQIGHAPERWTNAAAVLLSVSAPRPAGPHD
jgi:SAM-dependent methyltransferase